MANLYEYLGFKQPEYLENPYGIKIYIGTKDNEDWCVEIPKELAKKKCRYYNSSSNYAIYFVSEEHALAVAKDFTELARR